MDLDGAVWVGACLYMCLLALPDFIAEDALLETPDLAAGGETGLTANGFRLEVVDLCLDAVLTRG